MFITSLKNEEYMVRQFIDVKDTCSACQHDLPYFLANDSLQWISE